MIPIYVGFDPREACVYHVFCQSVIEKASQPVMFIPLHQPMLNGFDGQQDGTNAFIYSRYLVPYLQGFEGPAIFVDGDMIVNTDINELIDLFDPEFAVQVVKHDYKTKYPRKHIGSDLENDNIDYPRKNWSSVIIFNCAHPKNRILMPEFVADAGGAFLHRFQWLNDEEIGAIPLTWNWLEGEYEANPDACIDHHTLGAPGLEAYSQSPSSKRWHEILLRATYLAGQDPIQMFSRLNPPRVLQ